MKVREESQPETLYVISFTILHWAQKNVRNHGTSTFSPCAAKARSTNTLWTTYGSFFRGSWRPSVLEKSPSLRTSDDQAINRKLQQLGRPCGKTSVSLRRLTSCKFAWRLVWCCEALGVSNVVVLYFGFIRSQACSTCLQNTCQYQDL